MNDTVRAPCPDCGRETQHDVLHTIEVEKVEYHDTYDLLQCRGCEQVSLRQTTQIKDLATANHHPFRFGLVRAREELVVLSFQSLLNAGVKITHKDPAALPFFMRTSWERAAGEAPDHSEERILRFYPPSFARRYPECVVRIGLSVSEEGFLEILEEIYAATWNGLPNLAIMGVRAVFERVMISKVGDNGSFERNLEEFKKRGYISLVQFDALHDILEAAHASIHRSFTLHEYGLNTALDIMEGVLAAIYEHPRSAEKISERVPKRPRRPKSLPDPNVPQKS